MKASDFRKMKKWELLQYILEAEADHLEDEEEGKVTH